MQDPSDQEIVRANILYHDQLAESYDGRIEQFEPRVVADMDRLLEDRVFRHLPGPETARMLDLGCGTGYLEQFLAPRSHHVTAVDVAPGMLAVARRKFPTVRFVECEASLFEIGVEAWDLVCENALLHHIKSWEPVLERMMAGVRPGGFLVLGYEPNAVAFRLLAPLRRVYRRVFAERRVVAVNEALGTGELEAIAEYHQFFGYGLDPRAVADRVRAGGFVDVEIAYATRSFLAQVEDRTGLPVTGLGSFVRFGPLTPNFHLIARKGVPR
jgi:SAM-dependent methyltransferase